MKTDWKVLILDAKNKPVIEITANMDIRDTEKFTDNLEKKNPGCTVILGV